MPQKDIELILMRQLASHLSTATFIVDRHGNLVYYNEYAEEILGRRFEETGSMPVGLWSTLFKPSCCCSGDEIHPDELPLVMALRKQHPAQREIVIQRFDGLKKKAIVTAYPLLGQKERMIGAVAMFQEVNT